MNLFDFLNSINTTKEDLFEDPQAEKDYPPYMINRGLSYFVDTVHYANEMNIYNFLDKDIQYNFLLQNVSKKKRFSKWFKKDESAPELNMICEKYNCNLQRAQEYLSIFTGTELDALRKLYDRGGKSNANEGKS